MAGRPQSKSADYFPYKCNMHNDRRVKFFMANIQKAGYHPAQGYATFLMLLGSLCSNKERILHFTPREYVLVAFDFGNVEPELIEETIIQAVRAGLMEKTNLDNNKPNDFDLVSPFLDELLEPLMVARERMRTEKQTTRENNKKKSEKKQKKEEEKQAKLAEPTIQSEPHGIQKWLNDNCPEVQEMGTPITYKECQVLYDKYPKDFIKELFTQMRSWCISEPARKKKGNTYATFNSWAIRELPKYKQRKADEERTKNIANRANGIQQQPERYTPPTAKGK